MEQQTPIRPNQGGNASWPLEQKRILCFDEAKKTEGASRPRFRPRRVNTRALINATREKSDIASTSSWQEIFTRTCVIRLLHNLWRKRRSTWSLCRTCNLGQNKTEQQPSHPHPSEIKDEAPLWLVGRGKIPFILSKIALSTNDVTNYVCAKLCS